MLEPQSSKLKIQFGRTIEDAAVAAHDNLLGELKPYLQFDHCTVVRMVKGDTQRSDRHLHCVKTNSRVNQRQRRREW